MKDRFLQFTVFGIIVFIVVINSIYAPINIISWDAFGYYLYLPMKFIYNDLGFHHTETIQAILEKYQPSNSFYQAFPNDNGGLTIIYTLGMALQYAPSFFAGHLIAYLFNFPMDGFSAPYQYSLFVWSIVYSILGILLFAKVLKHLFEDKIAALVLFLVVFATNYIVHITFDGQNAYTHNYLFTNYAAVLLLTIKWHQRYSWKYSIALAVVTGIMILTRPTEVVCLLIPFFWNVSSIKTLKLKLELYKKYVLQIVVFGIILLLIGSFQFIYWKIQTGHFFYNSYKIDAGVGLDLFSPHTIDFLFSFRKGWFVYTPLAFFFVFGLLLLYKTNKNLTLAFGLFFIANIYLISSWACWWYAGSYSQRPMVSSLPISGILLGYYFVWIKNKAISLKTISYFVIGAFLLLNLFQTYQFRYYVIDSSRMTKAYYFATFGKLQVDENDRKLLLINRMIPNEGKIINVEEYSSKTLSILDFESQHGNATSYHLSGKKSFRLDGKINFSPKIEKSFEDITPKDHVWFKTSAFVYTPCDSLTEFSLVLCFIHNGYAYNYKTLNSEQMDLKPNQWNQISFYYLSPEIRLTSDLFTTYFWYRGKSDVFVDDVKVEVFEKSD